MSQYIQTDWSGGSNLLLDATQLADNENYLIINGRCRYGVVNSIQKPLQQPGLPYGNYQGVYAAGNFLIVFINGFAYYKDYSDRSGNAVFKRVEDFSMDSQVAVIYTALVPASTVNFSRIPTTPNTNDPINLVGTANSSPQCLVCQDGINQPWVIFSDGSSQVTKNYNQWTQTKREYVPIGKQMLYSNGILYIISADLNGRFTQINRSVSGRPLDFMVNIDINGDKLPQESDGGARSVSYRVDYDEVTALTAVNTNDGSFYISTNRNSYMVIPGFTTTLFGEPTFTNIWLFSAGAINSFSVVDILGDTALIDFVGIRSFNAVETVRIEGKNSPFSAKLSKLFTGIIQSVNAAGTSDNYAFFSMDTIFGPAIIVYDTLHENFVGIDMFDNLGVDSLDYPARIKQFAETKTNLGRRFFFITTSNHLYEYYASQDTAQCTVFLKEICSQDPQTEVKPTNCYGVFTDTQENGQVTFQLFVDRVFQYQTTETIDKVLTVITPPSLLIPPFGVYTKDNTSSLSVNFQQVAQGWKYMVSISWGFPSTLTNVKCVANDITMNNSLRSQIRAYANYISP